MTYVVPIARRAWLTTTDLPIGFQSWYVAVRFARKVSNTIKLSPILVLRVPEQITPGGHPWRNDSVGL